VTSPTISVVMPAYNSEKYIGRAIESILNQTHRDLELIIGEDRSTDSTWDIINEFAARDPRIKVFRNEKNSGSATTINHAVALATAPVIAAMDSDDVSVPYRLERQFELLRAQPEIAIVGSYVSHINDHEEVLSLSKTGPASVSEFEDLRSRGEPTMVFGGTAMFEKRRFEALGGFDASLRAAADIEFCDRMSQVGPVVAIPEALVLYRVYGTSNVMIRFREGRSTHRFLAARRTARAAGNPLPTRAEYLAYERTMPLWRRFNVWRDDFAQFYYRKAGLAFGEKHRARTGLYLVAAGIVKPLFVLSRAWHQRFSPEARRVRSGW
jgi:glycosyltransferase involved in cell wall biosynthesis